MEFLKAELAFFSNAKIYRRDHLVRLVESTVNLPQLDVIPRQQQYYGMEKGFLVCNSNYAVIGIIIPFATIKKEFGSVDKVSIVQCKLSLGQVTLV